MVELVDSVDLGSTARACRFESCCPHQIKRRGRSLSFLFGRHRTRTQLNADVRWTSACRQLDGGNSIRGVSRGHRVRLPVQTCQMPVPVTAKQRVLLFIADIYDIVQLGELEFGGESPRTMRHGLRWTNEMISRTVASIRSAYRVRQT